MGKITNAYKVFIGKSEGKRPHGRQRHRWEENVRMDLMKYGWMVWTRCIWLRIMSSGRLL
jgi:hypothetical protein